MFMTNQEMYQELIKTSGGLCIAFCAEMVQERIQELGSLHKYTMSYGKVDSESLEYEGENHLVYYIAIDRDGVRLSDVMIPAEGLDFALDSCGDNDALLDDAYSKVLAGILKSLDELGAQA